MNNATKTLVGFRELHADLSAGRSEPAFRLWLYRAVKAGRFPAPVCIGDNSRAWRADEVLEWKARLQRVKYAPATTATSTGAA